MKLPFLFLLLLLLPTFSYGYPTTTLCPYGEALPSPDTIVTALSRYADRTCLQVEQSSDFQSLSERDCLAVQVPVGIRDCGCQAPSCTACPPGSQPVGEDCDDFLQELYYEQLGFELGVFVPGQRLVADEESCLASRFLMGPGDCTCTPPQPSPCSFCRGGGPTNYDPEDGSDCFENERDVSTLTEDSMSCPVLQAYGHFVCGCEGGPEPVPQNEQCPLCGKGWKFNSAEDYVYKEMCELSALIYSYYPKDSLICRFIQLLHIDPQEEMQCCEYVGTTEPTTMEPTTLRLSTMRPTTMSLKTMSPTSSSNPTTAITTMMPTDSPSTASRVGVGPVATLILFLATATVECAV